MLVKSENEVLAALQEAFPKGFYQDAVRCLFQSYRTAKDESDKYELPEFRVEWPSRRRSEIESNFRTLANRYPAVAAEALPNSNGSAHHTRLSSNNVFLTISSVRTPGNIVRPAGFRQEYAVSNQFELFTPATPPPPEDHYLYAVLLHGPDRRLNGRKYAERPGFAHLAVPDKDCERYVARLNLFAAYPALIEELCGSEEQIPEPKVGTLRSRKKKSDDSEPA